ncbi:MAG TPA: DinB family protein [Egicoccus sp.]|nr:DinB family protein [Egicoccus sp.]HSK25021.1 DinB family protein [Egicoccus sp.]
MTGQERRSETDTLLAYLGAMRQAVVRDCGGLDDGQLRRPGVPSGTSLLGIVHHLTGVEQHWFFRVFLGDGVEYDKSFQPAAERSADEVIAAYRAVWAEHDDIVRRHPDLGVMAAAVNPGEDALDPLRSIVVHLVEETARHAGHADILREQIDGATGL